MLFENRFIDAAAKLMLFSAGIHMLLLFAMAFVRYDGSLLNYFKILNIDYIFPDFSFGRLSGLISFVVLVLIYLIFLHGSKDKK